MNEFAIFSIFFNISYKYEISFVDPGALFHILPNETPFAGKGQG